MSTAAHPENVVPRRRAADWAKPATPESTLIEHPDGSVTLSSERLMVCLESVWELEALANVLPGMVPNIAAAHGAHHAVRGLSDRIKRLSCVLISGLSDDGELLETLERRVFVGGRVAA